MVGEVRELGNGAFLEVGLDGLVSRIVKRCSLRVPTLHRDHATRHKPVDVPLPKDVWPRGRQIVQGTEHTVEVPFEGDSLWFYVQPSQHQLNLPHVQLQGQVLVLRYQYLPGSQPNLAAEFETDVVRLSRELDALRDDVSTFNASLEDFVRRELQERLQKLQLDDQIGASLALPLKKRPDVSSEYPLPINRRQLRPRPARPDDAMGARSQGYVVRLDDYDEVLAVIGRAAVMFERSPGTYREFDEEQLRDVLLLVLNAFFEGQATGETFNQAGKTDILVRDGPDNLLVAECKIWTGRKNFEKAIGQLLERYVTWRDTRLALIVFNKKKNLTSTLREMSDAIQASSKEVEELDWPHEGQSRFLVPHPSDERRKLVLTTMAFDVPAPES